MIKYSSCQKDSNQHRDVDPSFILGAADLFVFCRAAQAGSWEVTSTHTDDQMSGTGRVFSALLDKPTHFRGLIKK